MRSKVAEWLAVGTGVVLALRQCTWTPVPLAVVALLMLVMFAAGLQRRMRICWALVAFVGVYGVSLALNLQPATAIRVQRFAAFTIGMVALSPMVRNERLSAMRKKLLESMIATLAAMVCLSSLVWVYAAVTKKPIFDGDYYMFGFRGVFLTGMNLAPAACLTCLLCLNRLIDGKLRWPSLKPLFVWCCIAAPPMVIAAGSRICIAGLLIAAAALIWLRRKAAGELLGKIGRRRLVVGGLIAAVALGATAPVTMMALKRKMKATEDRSMFYSREKIWHARIVEFESSPLFGIGYAREFPRAEGDDDISYGTTARDMSRIEPGSSYLPLLSYGGVVGAGVFLWFVVMLVRGVYVARNRGGCPFYLSLLIFMAVNGIAEGWLMYAGSLGFPLFWLTASMFFPAEGVSVKKIKKI